MTEFLLVFALAIALGWPLGRYLAAVMRGAPMRGDRLFGLIERPLYALLGVDPSRGMGWKGYAKAFLLSNLVLGVIVWVVLMTQAWLPLNPNGIPNMRWDLALHTMVSFLTNTNQQHYSGQAQLSYLAHASAIVGLQVVTPMMGLALVAATLRGLFKSAPTQSAEAPKPATPGQQPKITDRVGQPSSSETLAPVAQRVVLYDEDPSDPKGKQYVGSVVWRTEQVKGAAGKTPEIAVRADIEIPERKFKMTMSFRRNTDTSLPASHTAELTFVLPPDFDGGGVSNVPGILMKSNELARGTPLAGLAVKVTDGFFLVGLSNVDADRSRNLQLLKERSWFDVPLVYTNQRRAIIAIEKGAPGERAFNEAFTAWGE